MFSVCLYIVRTDDHIHQTEFQTTQIQYADEAEYQQQVPWEFDLDSTSESYINQNHGNVHKGQEDGKMKRQNITTYGKRKMLSCYTQHN